MGSGRNKLSAAKVAKCSQPGYLLDGGGLYLQVTARAVPKKEGKPPTASGGVTKSWTFRYRDRANGKLRELGLGSYVDVSLEEARRKATELRASLREGKDPKAERDARRAGLKAEAAKGMTFDQAASACIADLRGGWKNEKHADQWINTLATYASPLIGSLPIATIDLPLIRKVLDPIWTTKNETASRVRQRLESVLAWATVSGYRTGDNPARWRGHLDHLLPKPSKVQKPKHHPALPYAEMGAFMAVLRERTGLGALALEFTILTAARTGEVISARWEELDLTKKLWTIPAERMKAGKEHTVPLSKRALEIVRELEKVKIGPFVFPGVEEGEPLSNMAMNATLKRMEYLDITVHGFRSTFRDWAGEQTNFPREIIEHALAHQLKDKAEAAYSRSTMPEKRRKLMEAWAKYCDTQESSYRLFNV
ncbi:MAG: integrase arm-type DNA-binding domain-containing protein [Holophaga sp.]|nr:integrase arm-type DNA-binding domain-containing protein [Holophaga sp.]